MLRTQGSTEGVCYFGIFLILLGAIYTFIGKVYERSNRWVYRSENPKRYWLAVGAYYLCGLIMIGLYLLSE
jgi:uncharacterized membrane protein